MEKPSLMIKLEWSLVVRQVMVCMECCLKPDDKIKAVEYLCGGFKGLKLERFMTLTLRVSRSRNVVKDTDF